jgi:CIC family chloride channel protein
MVVVTRARGKPKPADIVGVITKEHIADSVAASIKPYSP